MGGRTGNNEQPSAIYRSFPLALKTTFTNMIQETPQIYFEETLIINFES